jgi:hypothetical protein
MRWNILGKTSGIKKNGPLVDALRNRSFFIVSLSGNREKKSWVVLLSIKVAVITVSLILSLIFILSARLGDISVGGTGGVPLVMLLSAPQAA